MKGLLLKDMYLSWKYYKAFFVIAVGFAVMAVWSSANPFLVAYPFMLVSMIPVGLQNFDEASKWDVYCGTMPCTKAEIVSGKYLIGLIFALPAFLLNVGSQLLRMRIVEEMNWGELEGILSLCLMLVFLLPAISLPMVFRFGSAKGRIVQYGFIALVCGSSAAMSVILDGRMPVFLTGGTVLWLVVLAAAGLYALSWYLSIRFYEKREIQ